MSDTFFMRKIIGALDSCMEFGAFSVAGKVEIPGKHITVPRTERLRKSNTKRSPEKKER